MSSPLHIMVIAGEISSDNHGYKLIKELKKKGNVEITVIGGDKMAAVADRLEENIVNKAAVGFVEIIKLIPYFIKLKKSLVNRYFNTGSKDKIDALVLIDYPGFNVRLARIAHRFNIAVFYYITPQVWAWGKRRTKLLSKVCRKLFCVFKFEKELFKNKGGNIDFVGHPILEDIPQDINIKEFNRKFSLSNRETVVAVLPGSRVNEVQKHLPIIAEALDGLDCRIIIGKSTSVDKELINKYMNNTQVTEDIYELLKRADMAIVSSGTSTLETAVIGTPFITVYKIAAFSYLIAKLLVNIKFIAMVNILADKEVVPELIQREFTPYNLRNKVIKMLNSYQIRTRIKKELKAVSKKIGTPGASSRTAQSILDELS